MSIPRLRAGDRLILATHNDGKLKEFQELFAPFGLELVSAGALGLQHLTQLWVLHHESDRLAVLRAGGAGHTQRARVPRPQRASRGGKSSSHHDTW